MFRIMRGTSIMFVSLVGKANIFTSLLEVIYFARKHKVETINSDVMDSHLGGIVERGVKGLFLDFEFESMIFLMTQVQEILRRGLKQSQPYV